MFTHLGSADTDAYLRTHPGTGTHTWSHTLTDANTLGLRVIGFMFPGLK